jgi:hypothetical protein
MRVLLLLAVFLGLSVHAMADVKFADATAYKVDATSLDVVINDQTSREYPQVGYLSPTTFEQALRQWVGQRFQLTGNSVNTLRVTMNEGRITEKILPIQKGIRGWFKKEESVAYDGALRLEIAIIDPNGAVLSKAEASSMVGRTLIEGATQDDKRKTWQEMVTTAFDNADRELKQRLAEYMSRYIN